MAWRRWLVPAAAAAAWALSWAISGCDRDSDKPVTLTTVRDAGAATRPATTPPATALPASRPAISVLTIGGVEVKFPPARLILQQEKPTVELLLVSDDPIAALSPKFHGNRYCLTLPLDISEASLIVRTDMMARARSMERADSPDGIFLEGDRVVLQPFEWTVQFSENGPNGLTLAIQGRFLRFVEQVGQPVAQPNLVMVQGVLYTELEDPRVPRSKRPEPPPMPTTPPPAPPAPATQPAEPGA